MLLIVVLVVLVVLCSAFFVCLINRRLQPGLLFCPQPSLSLTLSPWVLLLSLCVTCNFSLLI